jgi:uncharacterized protein RhaS with RHS repeats
MVMRVWSSGNTRHVQYLPDPDRAARPWHAPGVATFVYDAADSRLTARHEAAGPGSQPTKAGDNVTQYTYDGLHRLTATTDTVPCWATLVFDAAGDMTTCTYDPDGQLTSRIGSIATFTYSSSPRRCD